MRRLAGAVLVAAVLVFAGAGSAQAHNYVVASSPVSGETLTALPDAFFLTTNEPMLAVGGSTAGFAFQIVDAEGLHYETGCVSVDGATMATEPRLGAAGSYTALWQIVSEDGHTVSDQIPFTWAPADGTEPTIGTASAPACGDALPSASATPGPSQEASAQPEASPASTVPVSDVLWVGGAVLAVGVAVVLTILLISRRKP